MRLRTAVLSVLVTSLAVVSMIVPAAASADGRVGLRPAAGAAGTRVTLEGSGFPPSNPVVISVSGARDRKVTANRGGAFRTHVTIPRRRGWVTIVSRSGRKRVVNKFFSTGAAGADQVIELSSSTGGRIRLSPTDVTPGATVQLRGTGFPAGKRLRLSWVGTNRKVTARGGRFSTSAVLPDSLSPGSLTGVIVGHGVRLLFHLEVSPTGPGSDSSGPPVSDAGLNPPAPTPNPTPAPNPTPNPSPPPPPPPTPPNNTWAPGISGTADKGKTLTANPGVWDGTQPITYSYQWESCTGSNPSCSSVSGATGQTFTIPNTSTYEGKYFRVRVTAKNVAGSATAIGGPSGVVPVPPPPPPPGTTVALWHMDAGGTMVDSIAGRNGSLHGGVNLDPFEGSNGAYRFDGSSGYVSVPAAVAGALDPGPADITITVHVKPAGLPNPGDEDADLIRKGVYSGSPTEWKMEYYPDGTALCGFKGTNTYAEVRGGNLSIGNWHTVTCNKTGTSIKLVVDGQTFSKSVNIGSINNTDDIVLGAHAAGSELFNGWLDEASISF